ncbi:MAG: TonB-dependent receptor plug domain-containing protein, partial [Bacteroidota bacterium]|nr:TonB-dependent receptor plug domain-containing protein [Bacteroidota bacterium]
MNIRIATAIALLAVPAVTATAQNESAWHERLDSVVVSTSRASAGAPVTHSELGREALEKALPSGSMPQTLQLLPSVVSYNEGGTGLGNSAMTIRGVKGSQINVTLNGVTLNDSESQEVFWVNIPALTAIIRDVQVQRGLGTSANGSGAFGASINMGTGMVPQRHTGRVSYSAGSWGTQILSLSAETARTEKGFYGSVAYSRTATDGYIRNARVSSQSAFVVLGWLQGRNSLRATWLLGDQVSGITWDGIDPSIVATDRTYNPAGEFYDEFGNVHYYPNAEDVYRQNHFQLNYTRTLRRGLTTSVTADYTRGDGYDEYYKTGRKFKEFGYPAAEMTGLDGNAYKKSDMIYRKRMDNDLYVLNADLRYRSLPLDITVGISGARYIGGHWGEMLWAKVLGPDYDYVAMNEADAWYRNSGRKTDLSAFARGEWRPLPWLTAYADLQLRRVHYSLTGRDDKASMVPMDYRKTWPFFNPRGGLTAD